ncbi:MAG: hypothetical protein OEY23_01205 [Acidimicrobiia bacterium]|nr:hypothetical protein [Acidimicrobiia bacterium]
MAVARDAVHVGVGLGILALQRFQADRPDLEAKLTELGLAPAAWATRQFGELLERQVAALVGAPRPSRRP